jgi:hypothetical protein
MRSMRVALTAAAVVACLWIASPAGAAVGDFRLVTGTVAWPLNVSGERTIVVQGEDGVMHFVELAPGETFRQLRAGDRVSVIGREGFKSDQLLFAQIERREDLSGGAPAALPTAVATALTPTDVLQSPDFVVGIVSGVHHNDLMVTTPRGNRVHIDIASIDADIRAALRPGDRVSVFAPNRAGGNPIASGILVDHVQSPAASPK